MLWLCYTTWVQYVNFKIQVLSESFQNHAQLKKTTKSTPMFDSSNSDAQSLKHFSTTVISGDFNGHKLFNEDEIVLYSGGILPGWRHGSRIWRLWLTGPRPCRVTLQRIYFVVQKEGIEENHSKWNSQDISTWMSCIQSSLFTVFLAVVLEQTKVVLYLWSQAHCVARILFSQQPYSMGAKHLVGAVCWAVFIHVLDIQF